MSTANALPPAAETAPAEPVPPAPAPPKQQPGPAKSKPLPPYRVLLHNDNTTPMDHVVRSLRRLTPLNAAQATSVMLAAHTRGIALVLVTHQERAELYAEQFRSIRLKVTIEPAD